MKKVQELLKNDDIRKVAFKAASSFKNCLTEEEIENCVMNAVWKASQRYNTDKSKCKFTTFLHKGVLFECLSTRKFNRNNLWSLDKYDYNGNKLQDNFNGFNRVDMLDQISMCDDPDLIYDRFYNNMTIKEIAKDRGVCGETIRIRLEKNLKKIKLSMTKGVS